ncbi:selenide, water dikinase SelD [Leptolyngbya sp. FACHB-36]|uniref:selenide, water dikinase SelD n=1 Tax=Leptolyngbya sp. FACHB-36 TaxID=2692808 RepID=UPI0016816D2E|nr:selenide, water dikinase SelD [Leptolyngbya sp. FACHB-36]MBD2022526.1 selenide, water dikinase SelD [Leptolyngbya sp. FACHB-36]
MKNTASIVKDLVLIGGGHSHAIVLRMFGMKPLSGVRVTLITEASDTAYSGMLPGHVAGFYSHEECHIDLRVLTQFAGAQLYVDRVVGLDLQNNRVLCADRPPVAFDCLSIDIGSTPKLPAIHSDPNAIIPAKPVRRFLEDWSRIVDSVTQFPEKPIRIGVVGGGTGGVELALTMHHRLQQIFRAAQQPDRLTLHMFQRDAELMPTHNRWVRNRLRSRLTERGVQLHLRQSVREVTSGQVRCESGLSVDCDFVIWVTQASAPDWLSKAGLAVDEDGFVLVDDGLRSSHPQVFAAGDIATMVNHPRPKAGVFAVRQGKPLFDNLRRALQDQPLRPFRPQTHYLSLIGTGDESAIADWGSFGWESPLLWRLKDRIDRAFMRRFSHLPTMEPARGNEGRGAIAKPLQKSWSEQDASDLMRCAGCGSKVGSTVLSRVLQRIQSDRPSHSSVLVGLDTPDDAAVIQIPPNRVLVQTIDYFPALINDPFLFGQISANHALSDVFAMGAQPQSALAIATVPYARDEIVEETLYQLLSGALRVLHQADAALIGGHTTEGADLAFGLSCNGVADPDRLLRKGGMEPGQVIILTKPIGTGTLFAAQMRQQATGHWIERAIAAMCQSNQAAAACFLEYRATACTDVTGFGLIGHLLEMVRASRVAVTLNLATVPMLEGARETVRAGILSSLHPQNLRSTQFLDNLSAVDSHPDFPLLFDPQTSGGLLASVPAAEGDRCLTALKMQGYLESAIIGQVVPLLDPAKLVTIVPTSW